MQIHCLLNINEILYLNFFVELLDTFVPYSSENAFEKFCLL